MTLEEIAMQIRHSGASVAVTGDDADPLVLASSRLGKVEISSDGLAVSMEFWLADDLYPIAEKQGIASTEAAKEAIRWLSGRI